jgi:hypothetical protein
MHDIVGIAFRIPVDREVLHHPGIVGRLLAARRPNTTQSARSGSLS